MSALWILAGIVGGALAGALDAGVAIAGGIGGMSVAKALRLIVLSASLLAFAGGLGGLAIAAGEALVIGPGIRRDGRARCGRSRSRPS